MLRLLSLLLFLALAILCVWVAVENRQLVTVVLGPLNNLPPVPLFYVFFAGLALGAIVIAFRASLSRVNAKRKLNKANKTITSLQNERDALAAERDHLAASVRPEDERLKQAQISGAPAPGSLIGPTSGQQSVIPG